MASRIAHIISGLETGGAEMMLLNLLAQTDRTRWDPAVWSLRDRGTLGNEVERLNAPLAVLGWGRGFPSLRATWRAGQALRAPTPALLAGWMYHGNVAAILARVALRRLIPVVWNIQYTPYDLELEKPATELMIRSGARLSQHATRIIYNSHAGARRHAELGYHGERSLVIPNGVDVDRFVPSAAARAAWRSRLGAGLETVLVGRFARHHLMKDYPGFLEAASQVVRVRPGVRFVLAGQGVDTANRTLMTRIARLGLGPSVVLLGEVRPTHALTAALDIACSSSAFGEGCPGVLLEAMACGIPCVTTDVGDSARIIGETGAVVPPRDPPALAAALLAMVDAGPEFRRRQGDLARSRIREHFTIEQVAGQYQSVFEEAIAT